jgi:hypothetical protein
VLCRETSIAGKGTWNHSLMICSVTIITFYGHCHGIGGCQREGSKWHPSLGSLAVLTSQTNPHPAAAIFLLKGVILSWKSPPVSPILKSEELPSEGQGVRSWERGFVHNTEIIPTYLDTCEVPGAGLHTSDTFSHLIFPLQRLYCFYLKQQETEAQRPSSDLLRATVQ